MVENSAIAAAKEYAGQVRKIMNPQAIYLYGSHAKGTANHNSDIDIAVIVDSIQGDYLTAISNLWKLTRSVNDDIEPVLLTTKDDDNGFLKTIIHTGIAV